MDTKGRFVEGALRMGGLRRGRAEVAKPGARFGPPSIRGTAFVSIMPARPVGTTPGPGGCVGIGRRVHDGRSHHHLDLRIDQGFNVSSDFRFFP